MPSAVSRSSSRGTTFSTSPHVVRGRRVDELAGHVEVLRAADADETRETLSAAASGDEPELDLRLAELRVVGRDADVAAHRELEPSAEAEPVDRCNERRARRVHPVPELLDPAGRAALVRIRCRLAQRRELLDVRSRDEGALAGADEHDRADAVVGVETVDLGFQLVEERRRERVHRRVVDRDDGDRAVLLGRDEVAH